MADEKASSAQSSRDSTEQKDSEVSKPLTPPNGGLRAWLQVAGSFLVFFNVWGLVLSFGVFQSYYQATLLHSYSPSDITWIGTTEVFCLNFVGAVTGPLLDLGYHDVLVYISGAMVIFGVMMLSLSTEFYQMLLSQGICLGIGSGMLYVPSLALVAGSFTTKRAMAVTLVTAGGSIGGIVYSVVFRYLVPKLGFGWTVRVMGFMVLGTTLFSIPIIRTGKIDRGKKPRPLLEIRAFGELPYLIYNIGGFLKFMGFYTPLVFIPVFVEIRLRAPPDEALNVLVYANAASFVGRLVAAWVADKIGVMATWLACAVSSSIICLTWLAVENYGGMVAFSVTYGFFSGALVSLPSAVLPYVSPLNVLGTRMGMTWALAGTALLIGSPIAGALIDLETANFRGMQIFVGVLLSVGTAFQLPLWWLIRDKTAATKAG